MSQKAYVEFYEKFLPSPAGASVVSKLKAVKTEDEYTAIALEAGHAAGYEFTADDARAVMKNSEAKRQASGGGELSQEQLDNAVGGALSSQSVVNLGASLKIGTLATGAKTDLSRSTYSTVMCPW